MVVGEFRIDMASREVSFGGKTVPLTLRELELVSYLASNSGRWVGNRELVERAFRLKKADASLVRVNVHTARGKLVATGVAIESRRGLGYRIPER